MVMLVTSVTASTASVASRTNGGSRRRPTPEREEGWTYDPAGNMTEIPIGEVPADGHYEAMWDLACVFTIFAQLGGARAQAGGGIVLGRLTLF